ncbi:hypothetical protein DCAR_0728651 [Daucus carota subsp. sativus]|uniref:Uncharacterized protein n=1 Tax=Daucus carota subsp. sativus TaxID=79200 RepID=A0AAF0XMH1_DAUCS|nr:hypothetical protein DCAR_0728651 [Daucus carota subsp. sativus]
MMSKLRFLYLKNVNLRGSFEQTFENLRWLRWECCALKCLPSDFCPQKLVTLKLPHSEMRSLWELNMVFEKLMTLDMSFSLDFTVTPDFTRLSRLETLNLKGCKSLRELHVSIGCLASLVSLNLGGCVNLRSLPHNISNLSALKSLNIDDCSALKRSLTEVNMWGLTVWKLPISIGRLSKLV